MRRAALGSTAETKIALDANLSLQALAVEAGSFEKFGKLDYAFHDILCKTADVDFAFEVISVEKANVDRLCMLSLSKEDRMPELLDDHTKIAACVVAGDAEGAVAIGRVHLSRLDATIDAIFKDKPEYFEP
jgi:DNA-binding GntR family transcriptional regulator